MAEIEASLQVPKDYILGVTYKLGMSVKEFWDEFEEYKAPFSFPNFWTECGE